MVSFSEMLDSLVSSGRRSVIAVVWGADHTSREAVVKALEAGFASAVFVGCRAEVEADASVMAHASIVDIVDADNPDDAAAKAVALVRDGNADILMKGLINTDNLLRAVLNKETGILPKGSVLTHLTVAEIPAYHKLLCFSDAAVIPYPTDEQREAQVRYCVDFCRRMGVERPRVALTHCSEKVDEKHFPFTADYRRLATMAADGAFGDCIVDGPMDVKTACSPEALAKKGLTSPVNGDADVLVFPDIEAGNAFYKTITLFAGADNAGMLCGTTAPVVLASRGDSLLSKFHSILIAAIRQ